jgi:succinate dehydrogenase / fumarate reductase membrane anchor subunit
MLNKTVTGAGYGVRDWLVQRVSAVAMLLYSGIFTVRCLLHPVDGFAAWRALFAPEWMRLASFLCVLALVLHAWVGVRDIFMDYVKPAGARLALHAAAIVALAAYAVWAARIFWSF